ncbi:hypothetical protein [Thiocystis violascens]|uniref:Uncharacterized protein n=1 Tax=Thiocystis violascens (strain ATCC 17096 / DSM 198 / 6111) TaxID=765911 RepID=I3YGX7_THIV6|nr:hypothetical protein [Thiocystis violascens]AFL76245.1 hypothetical protein Thivi_4443 [Thiocystis violascens DSM 198]
MTITVYRSDDASAPVLTGEVGKLIDLLDACLVNGYGSQPAAGWGKAFSGTNLAAYRAPSGNRMYLRVDDSIVQYPILRGYETLTGIDTGTGPFPTTAQLAGGIRPVKSSTTGTVAHPWMLIAGTRAFYLWISFVATDIGAPATTTDMIFFGDIVSYLPGDQYGTLLIGKIANDITANNTVLGNNLSAAGADCNGHYLARGYLQDGGSSPCGTLQALPAASASIGSAGAAYPDPVTGGLLLERVRVCEGGVASKLLRGHLPGLFNPQHNQPGQHLDTLSGRGALSGTDLLLLYKGGTAVGRFAVSLNETADWLAPA